MSQTCLDWQPAQTWFTPRPERIHAIPKPTPHSNRGLDMAACRKMLYEAGFAELQRGDGSAVPLDHQSLISCPN